MNSFLKRSIQGAVRAVKSGSLENSYCQEITTQLVPVPEKFDSALFNFSIDFELGLGNAHDPDRNSDLSIERRIADFLAQKENTLPFIDLITQKKFPVTWALISMLIDQSKPISEKFQPEWASGDWYKLPNELEGFQSLSEEILKKIESTFDWCELATHGHAHIDYDDLATTEEIAIEDLRTSLNLFRQRFSKGVNTFVYPCNNMSHLRILGENGINIIRGDDYDWHVEPDLIRTPVGFWISPGVMSTNDVKKIIDQSVEKKAFVHPWMHLVECDLKCSDLENFYRPIFEYVLELQDKGKIKAISFEDICKTMK